MKTKSILSFLLVILVLLSMNTNSKILAESKPTIAAETAILIDGNTGQILYSKNSNKKMYPASITKLMTALLSSEALSPTNEITFSDNAINSIRWDSSRIGIKVDETIRVNDAMHGLLLMSANEVANALAEETSGSIDAFVDDMNARAIAIGALNTHFENPHGLYDPNHYTTAYDMALITKEVVQNDFILTVMKESMYQIPPTNKETEIRYLAQQHKMLNEKKDTKIYRSDVIAGKIGYTSESGHTLVTVSKQGNQILIAVIMKVAAANLYTDTNKLLDYGYNAFEMTTLPISTYTKKIPIYELEKQVGTATLTLNTAPNILLPLDATTSDIQTKYNVPDKLDKNIVLNDENGSITLLYNDTELFTYPLSITDISIIPTKDNPVDETLTAAENSKSKPSLPGFFFILFILFLLGFVFYVLANLHRRRLLRRLRQNKYRATRNE